MYCTSHTRCDILKQPCSSSLNQGVSRQALQPEGTSGRPQPHLDGCNLLEKLFHMLVLGDLLRCSWRLHIPTGAAWPRGGLCALQDGQSKLWVRSGCAALPDCAPVLWSDRLLWLRRSLGSCQVQEHPAMLMRQPCTAGRLNSLSREQQIQATCRVRTPLRRSAHTLLQRHNGQI